MVEKLKTERIASSARKSRTAKPRRFSEAHFAESPSSIAVYSRPELEPGARLQAPCIVTEYSATTLIPTGARASVDEQGNLIIEP
jgi:N-methylhydantoinase A